jgi:putative GTP pyrophosphokinase
MMNPQMKQLKMFRDEITRFLLQYQFALKEMETKIEILKEEFESLHDYCPIEHTKFRLKSPESIINKLYRKGGEISFDSIRKHVMDIAGIRITCSFLSDIYKVSDMLRGQSDLKILDVKDYVKNPKPNGYQSLHLLLEVPIFLSDRVEHICVEVQIRTIAMDFWASLEHKIFYKYNDAVPEHLLKELKAAADTANALDHQMERLHNEVQKIKQEGKEDYDLMGNIKINNQQFRIPAALLNMLNGE